MIDVDQIKKLRNETAASIADIKEALSESDGNEAKAKKILKKKGLDRANKKSERKTSEGIVESYIHQDKKSGAAVVLGCETDFVARNLEFEKLAHEIAMQVCAMEPADIDELLNQPWIKDQIKTISDLISENIAKFGENIKIKEIKKFHV